MPIKRLVVVADRHNLEKLASALVTAGVEATEVHVSEDCATQALREMGVKMDIPYGRIPLERAIDQASELGIP